MPPRKPRSFWAKLETPIELAVLLSISALAFIAFIAVLKALAAALKLTGLT
jgi:hypothetical protein